MKSTSDRIESGRVKRRTPWAGRETLFAVGILIATFLAYLDTLALGFVFDDHVLIVTNDSIRSWRYFPTYFTSHIWSFRYPHLLANYYRPLFLTWLRLNDARFGLHAWGWHLTSVLAHVAVTWLVYRLALRLTRDAWMAGVAGLIFGLHPVHAEAVAYLASIQEPLSTFFIIAAILAFTRCREVTEYSRLGGDACVPEGPDAPGAPTGAELAGSRPDSGMAKMAMAQEPCHGHPARAEVDGQAGHRTWASPGRPWHKGRLAMALVFEAAALLSKESGMVLPLLIAAYAWIYGRNSGREAASVESRGRYLERFRDALWASIPFWVVLLTYVPARIHALKGFTHVITPLPLSTVIFTIPSVVLFYLRLLVWPAGLSCYYDTPYVTSPTWNGFFVPALALIGVAAALGYWYFRTRRKNPAIAPAMELAFVWMVLTILPVLNLRFLPSGEIAHDRYVYLPSVGFVILVAVALAQFRRFEEMVLWPVLRVGFAAALVLVMGVATARQNLFWSDDLTLNARAHSIAPNNVYATTSLAAAVAEQGMEGAAVALYQQVLARQPNFWRANVNLAYLEYSHGNYPQATHYFARACASDPTDGDEFLYLGMSLLRTGKPEEAEKAVRTALLVRPAGQNYHLGLAMVLKGEGKLAEAKTEVQTELASNPQNAQAKGVLEELDRQISAATP